MNETTNPTAQENNYIMKLREQERKDIEYWVNLMKSSYRLGRSIGSHYRIEEEIFTLFYLSSILMIVFVLTIVGVPFWIVFPATILISLGVSTLLEKRVQKSFQKVEEKDFQIYDKLQENLIAELRLKEE